MTDNERIAKFMGWKEIQDPNEFESVWEGPNGYLCIAHHLPFDTNYNHFIEAWNKAVEQLNNVPERGFGTDSGQWKWIARNVEPDGSFTIEKRMKCLLKIIDFLNTEKP